MNSVFTNAADEYELGTNYIISGHNARISAYWRNGSYAGPGSGNGIQITSPTGAGQHRDSFVLAVQLQY